MMMMLQLSVSVIIIAIVLVGLAAVGAHAVVTQDEALVLGEFFVAVKFGNTTPVTMDNACTNWPGKVTCDSNNTVITALDFSLQALFGTLPASLFGLSQLHSIILDYNNITGPLPSSFANFQKLVTFTANYNQLSGTLPSEFSSWRHIDEFSLPFNSLVGTLPDSYKSWTTIRAFDVRNNKLNGTLPREYSAWNSTTKFHVEDNRMSGTLPPEYSNWTNIAEFIANDNGGFYGTLPAEYARWGASLLLFYIGGNLMSGVFPPVYSNWTSIIVFSAANNSFSGALPPEYDAWAAVQVLRMQYNLLSGTLPSRYSVWSMVRYFSANNNMFDGTLPPQYASWQSIDTIYLRSNLLTGSIPLQYKSWGATVTSIVLDNNQLTGTIPSEWGSSMTQLDVFSVSNNSLSGTLPQSMRLPMITILSFGFNNISGFVPPIPTWPKLKVFDVQNNTHLTGSLPLPTTVFAATVCGTKLCLNAAPQSAIMSCMQAGLLLAAVQSQSVVQLLTTASENAYSLTACSATTTAAPALPTAAPPQQQFASHQQPITSPTVRAASAAMVYTTIIAGGLGSTGRGGVPGLQRAVASLRLAARCNAATSSTSRSNTSSIGDDDAPMFSDLADNPLGVSVSVGGGASAPSLDAAAGASVMNAVLVCVIGVALHVSAKLQRWWLKRAQRSLPSVASASSTSATVLQVLVSLVPSALLPGSLAAPFGALLQPGIGACVVLVVSSARGASSKKKICVASNTVISELNFTSQGLLGTLPASLFRLSQLYSITLNKNNI
ncbi:membrane-associated protein, putative, partial [Bodo saltans]